MQINYKVSPHLLKILGVILIVASVILYPISAFTFAKTEPPVVLGLSWIAIIVSGLAFYSSAQDGTDIDEILDNQKKIIKKLK